MGFANSIRFMLAKDEKIAVPLLSFNLGLEAGQIVLVSFILFTSYLLVDKMKMKRLWWVWAVSGFCLVIATSMVFERWPST